MRRCVWFPIIALTAVLIPARSARAQRMSADERDLGRVMLKDIHEALDEAYFDSTFGGKDEKAVWDKAEAQLDSAYSASDMLGVISEAVQDLGDSHTWFIPPGVTTLPDYGWMWEMVGEDCYVGGVKRKSDAYAQGLRRGDRVFSIDRIVPTRKNLDVVDMVYYSLNPRSFMQVNVEHPNGKRQSMMIKTAMTNLVNRNSVDSLLQALSEEYRKADSADRPFRTVDSVAIWHYESFGYHDKTIDKAMKKAKKYPWLVLDLRGNLGGAIDGVERMLSYFADSDFTVFRWQRNRKSDDVRIKPKKRGHGYHGHVIVLIDSQSASSSEITAWTLQHRFHATVMGDQSAGAVRVSIYLRGAAEEKRHKSIVPYGLQVAIADAIMPDGKSLEGRGVIPDKPILPTPTDMAEGKDPVMAAALAMAGVTDQSKD